MKAVVERSVFCWTDEVTPERVVIPLGSVEIGLSVELVRRFSVTCDIVVGMEKSVESC